MNHGGRGEHGEGAMERRDRNIRWRSYESEDDPLGAAGADL
jgi:hypothetical protein